LPDLLHLRLALADPDNQCARGERALAGVEAVVAT
jgi:hypothetical protein